MGYEIEPSEAHHREAVDRYFTASEDPQVVRLRELIVTLGAEILANVPDGRNRSIALTTLEDVQMRANRGIFAPIHVR